MKFEHVALKVSDFQRSTDFYNKYFGFEQVDSWEGPPEGKEIHLKSGDMRLELFLVKDSAKEPDLGMVGKNDRGLCHLCLNTDNINDFYKKMKDDGIPMTLDLTSFTLDSGKKGKCFFFKDPDDTIIEIIEWIQ